MSLDRACFVLLLASTTLACGGTTESSSSAGTGGSSSGGSGGSMVAGSGSGAASSGGAGGSGASATGGSGGETYVKCPSKPPAAGSACAETGLSCTWGDDPRFACRETGFCLDSAWTLTAPAPTCSVDPFPPGCPATPQAGACDDDGLGCMYDDGTACTCTSCPSGSPVCGGGPPAWDCVAPTADCPPFAPNEGTRCESEGQRCDYTCEVAANCADGAWSWTRGLCPICVAPDTPIATPDGDRPVAELKEGDLVYSVEGSATVVVPLLRVARTRVHDHQVTVVHLDDGEVLHISPGHPTVDGRRFDELTPGSLLGQRRVTLVTRAPYVHSYTHDILPATSSGAYYAAGALIGSTLAQGGECRGPAGRSRRE